MRYRKLRIAWSLVWGLAGLLMILLWVRSYWRYDWLGGLSMIPGNGHTFIATGGCLFESANGAVIVIFKGDVRESLSNLRSFGTSSAEPNLRVIASDGESARNGFRFRGYGDGTFRAAAPHWFVVLIAAALTACPWIHQRSCRFSLRTLLIATTLVAIVLGLAVWASR